MTVLWDFIYILWLLLKLAFVLLERAITGRIINHFKNKELLEIGTQLTFYYFLIILIFFGGKLPELYHEDTGINGVGDFLAGLFSPIAFCWLIIGYLMQNKELKNSVEQTREAQKLAKDQLEFQKEVEDQIRKEKQKKAITLFSIIPLEPNEDTKNLIKKICQELPPIPTKPSFNTFKIHLSISIKTINNKIYNIKIYNQHARDDGFVFRPILIEKISPNVNEKVNLTLSVKALEELRNRRELKIPFNYININGDLKKNFIIIEKTVFGFNFTIPNQRVKVLSNDH